MGGVQWTPQVSANYNAINTIKLAMKKAEGGKVKATYLKRQIAKSGLSSDILKLPIEELKELEAKAQEERRQYKKHHVERRDAWIVNQQSRNFDRGKVGKASRFKAMKNKEKEF